MEIKNENFRNYYEIIKEITECDFGSIYEVKKKDTEEKRAIKVIDKNIIKEAFIFNNSREPSIEEMISYIKCFHNEINNMSISNNEKNINLVKFYECFESENEFAIVMELCDENLTNLLSKEKMVFDVEQIYDIITQLNNAFKLMVQNNLVYLDLKLENILIQYKDKEKSKYIIKLKLTDFSDRMINLRKYLSSMTQKYYTNCLKAPEILKGQKNNEKSNLWSLGIIIYVLAFKKYPFIGISESSLLNSIIRHEQKDLKKHGNSDLDDLIKKLLVIDPKKRIGWAQYFSHSFFNKNKNKINFRNIYEIGENIGESKYAKVYRSKMKGSNELKAIKIYDKQKIKNDLRSIKIIPNEDEMKPYIDRFYNEFNNMKIVEGVNKENKNTVKVYDYYHTMEEFAIVMELCDDNLLNFFSQNKKTFSSKEIYNLLYQLNNSFKIMKKKKLIHTDLNLENILIKYENKEKTKYIFKLKLTDSSGLIDDLFKNKKFNNNYYSNFNFIAPEILTKQNYNEKSDLWSLGIIIYVLYFRNYPFSGKSKTEILKEMNNFYKDNLIITNNDNLTDLIQKLLVEESEKRISWNEYFNHSFFKKDFKNYYDIIEKIGEGGFATVYKIKSKENGEKRAAKVFSKKRIKEELMKEKIKEITKEEMKLYIKSIKKEIDNMNIVMGENRENMNTVKYYDYFENKNEFVIIMELCDKNLTKYLTDKYKPYNPEEIREILNQLNNSFKIMAEKKLVHRDLKLENILIKYESQNQITFKLTDYGLSKQLNSISEKMKSKVGTFHFMSPEILKGENYDEKCDLWSLGVIIYVLCFKQYPYNGNTEFMILELIKNKGQSDFKKTNDYNLNNLIEKLLNPEPKKRLSWEEYFNHPFFKNNLKNGGDNESNISFVTNTIEENSIESKWSSYYHK